MVYRAGFARTRRHARQLVVHGHFKVNGKKVDIPSFQVSQHDVIDVKEKSLETTPFIVARETHGERIVPAWMDALPEPDAHPDPLSSRSVSRSTSRSRSSSSSSTTRRSRRTGPAPARRRSRPTPHVTLSFRKAFESVK